mgnify:CR=1 FL=1
MPDYQHIYRTQADRYDRLVAREDCQGHLWPALTRVQPFAGRTVVELGAGTGRLTALLAPVARTVYAFDISAHMLHNARQRLSLLGRLSRAGRRNHHLAVADNRRLPLADGLADVTLAGWSLGHFTAWCPETWRPEIGAALAEMRRVTRPGGTLVLIETLGTGHTTPCPPSAGLAEFYRLLEQEWGWTATWVRTDYCFESLAEAETLTRFFFGDAPAERVVQEGWVVLPECTGIWKKF